MDGERPAHLLSAVRDQSCRSGCNHRWYHNATRRTLDAADGPQRDRCAVGSVARQALPHHRSRYKILAAISAAGAGQRDRSDPPAADVAEFELVRGALRTLDQRRMPESYDIRRAGIVTPCGGRIYGALPLGTQPSGCGEPVDRSQSNGGEGRRNHSPCATRRHIEFLSPHGHMTSAVEYLDRTTVACRRYQLACWLERLRHVRF